MNLLDLEFLATGSERYRYPLEKNGHGRKQTLCKQNSIHANAFERHQLLHDFIKRGFAALFSLLQINAASLVEAMAFFERGYLTKNPTEFCSG